MNTREENGVNDEEQRENALRTVRVLMGTMGLSQDEAINNPAIPKRYRDFIRSELDRERNIILEPAHVVTRDGGTDWYRQVSRALWYYWPELRSYLLQQGWSLEGVRSLDQTTDRIMARFFPPDAASFDVRGLVLGYVQSGKTSNFTATIAKAADCGYRLFIVLSGIDKGLRRQTQIRLERELMGFGVTPGDSRHVRVPPQGKQWHKFTTSDIDGDFSPGTANQASLQGPEPVIMVIKKNGSVLRRLIQWLGEAPGDSLKNIPTLLIDDEADLASVDTSGTYATQEEPLPDDYEPPSMINKLIRELLTIFSKRVYIAYTATPFANILIAHDAYDPDVEKDLYPKDFIIDLPKPASYFGAEELFGSFEMEESGGSVGLDLIRPISEQDLILLDDGQVPPSLEEAMLGFVLSGAARAYRFGWNAPSTMLIHTDYRIATHMDLAGVVSQKFAEFRDSWRYYPDAIVSRLQTLWESDYSDTIDRINPDLHVEFDRIRDDIGRFFESVQVRTINSFTGAVLDYEREPDLKSIGIGGNKLSRGLTLEGLTTSFFVRNSPAYDTLMQMGRWFGFREGYVDLTRIWTTRELADKFALLALVERRLRDDIRVYEDMHLTPMELGMRIWQHPAMQVTSYLKRRHARKVMISQSYSEQLEQTFKFVFDRPQDLARQQDLNKIALTKLIERAGSAKWSDNRPIWYNISVDLVLEFLSSYQQDDSPENSGCSLPLICSYIEKMRRVGELVRWTVSICGRESRDSELGETDWNVEGKLIYKMSRSKLKNTYSLGVITSPGDEKIGLSDDMIKRAEVLRESEPGLGEAHSLRRVRPSEEGLLLIYPISRHSRPETRYESTREPLYENPSDPFARDIIALAISFPKSRQDHPVEAYLEGTVGWRPYDEQP